MTRSVRRVEVKATGSQTVATEVSPTRRAGAQKSKKRTRSDRVAWLYVGPPLALFAFVIIAPLFYAAWIGFFNWDGIGPATNAGLDNYLHSFTDPIVRQAFLHSLALIAFYSVFPICIGLALTGVIARARLKLVGLWRTLLFLPQALSIVVVGVAWQWLLQADGPVNQLLRLVGLGGFTRVWLGDLTWALPAEGAIGTWMMSGLCMVLLMAGAQAIDQTLYDAAKVDGAGAIRESFTVTVPGLRNTIVVCAVLTFATSLNNFVLVWVTTKGGPANATQVLPTVVYTRAFVLSDLGAASALAILLGVLMMVVSYFISRRTVAA
jgi:raffinose/stachyose/melibiose transport system permease protein